MIFRLPAPGPLRDDSTPADRCEQVLGMSFRLLIKIPRERNPSNDFSGLLISSDSTELLSGKSFL